MFMAQANDQQMQQYADQRIRVRAEQCRALFAAIRDDKAAIQDIYDRAIDDQNPWTDSRTDGPPRLLESQDHLVFNTIITNLIALLDGEESGDEGQIAAQRAAIVSDIRANWAVFQSTCVRPILS